MADAFSPQPNRRSPIAAASHRSLKSRPLGEFDES
jgi:hypothetical protein